eukprot:PhM_4_TR18701/c0_g1_i1/m.7910
MDGRGRGRGGGMGGRGRGGPRDDPRDDLPKPPVGPDRKVFETKMDRKRDEVKRLRTRLQAIQDKLSNREPDPEREAYYAKQKDLSEQIKKIRDEIRTERDSRKVITDSIVEDRRLREDLESKL